jgi:undecaprenyl diphosphate synthase
MYFTDVLWPEFGPAQLDAAFEFFARRERRFGRTSAQVAVKANA